MSVAYSEGKKEISASGAFVRQENAFTTAFGSGAGELPVAAGKYRLITAGICPWAHRQLITLSLLGIGEDVISVGRVNPVRTDSGWEFSLDAGGVDPVLKIRYLSEAYLKADPAYNRRATVPAVVDIASGKVVNNDYHKLSNYWETAWRPFFKEGAPDLYPQNLRGEIDELNAFMFDKVNNGVYKAWFARTREAYEQAYNEFFAALDILEARLAARRYLFGDAITDSDIRLYVTLVRFDIAYYIVMKCNRNRLIDFPHLWNYAKDLYETPGFGSTTDFDAIKRGYYLNKERNPFGILPLGPDMSIWKAPVPGAFVRQSNAFTKPFKRGIKSETADYLPVEAGRYRLIWSGACPWATRQMIALKLLGLEDVISVGLVDPVRPRPDAPGAHPINGSFDMPNEMQKFRLDWAFTLDPDGRDPVLGVRYLSDLYFNANPQYTGRFTVPAIIDIPSKKVAQNDYFNLTYYWALEWRDFHKAGAPDLYPEHLREKINALNNIIFHEINNGVYKAGFAKTQAAYEDAYKLVFRRLDWIDGRLSESRYLFGDALTDSDIRLYVTLIRFDFAYYNAFKVNRQRIKDFPALFRYTKDLYNIPAFRESTLFEHIKKHYHLCCDPGNIYGIVPLGPNEADYLKT